MSLEFYAYLSVSANGEISLGGAWLVVGRSNNVHLNWDFSCSLKGDLRRTMQTRGDTFCQDTALNWRAITQLTQDVVREFRRSCFCNCFAPYRLLLSKS